MNFLFAPFTLVNHYHPFYAYPHPFFIDNTAYLVPQTNIEKQIVAQKQTILLIPPENVSQIQDQGQQCEKNLKSPNKREDKNFGFREQDKQRNIYSNILKAFFICLCQKRSMDTWILKLLSESPTSLNLVQILEKVEQVFEKNRSYFSPKQVRQTLKRTRIDENVRKIIGKCLYRFLKSEFSLSLLVSTRIKRKSKILQMKKARELLNILNGSH